MKQKLFFYCNLLGLIGIFSLSYLLFVDKFLQPEVAGCTKITVKAAKKKKSSGKQVPDKFDLKKHVEAVYEGKIFVPYRGLAVKGPDGRTMPTISAPRNLELVGITMFGSDMGAIIIVPHRRQLNEKEILEKLQKFGDSEWASWMLATYVRNGRRVSDMRLSGVDKDTEQKWQSILNEIFTELEFDKRFFKLGEAVGDGYVLTALHEDGVSLKKGSQEVFLAMNYSSRQSKNRIRKMIAASDRMRGDALWDLYRRRWAIVSKSRQLEYAMKWQYLYRRYFGALYQVGTGRSPDHKTWW